MVAITGSLKGPCHFNKTYGMLLDKGNPAIWIEGGCAGLFRCNGVIVQCDAEYQSVCSCVPCTTRTQMPIISSTHAISGTALRRKPHMEKPGQQRRCAICLAGQARSLGATLEAIHSDGSSSISWPHVVDCSAYHTCSHKFSGLSEDMDYMAIVRVQGDESTTKRLRLRLKR